MTAIEAHRRPDARQEAPRSTQAHQEVKEVKRPSLGTIIRETRAALRDPERKIEDTPGSRAALIGETITPTSQDVYSAMTTYNELLSEAPIPPTSEDGAGITKEDIANKVSKTLKDTLANRNDPSADYRNGATAVVLEVMRREDRKAAEWSDQVLDEDNEARRADMPRNADGSLRMQDIAPQKYDQAVEVAQREEQRAAAKARYHEAYMENNDAESAAFDAKVQEAEKALAKKGTVVDFAQQSRHESQAA